VMGAYVQLQRSTDGSSDDTPTPRRTAPARSGRRLRHQEGHDVLPLVPVATAYDYAVKPQSKVVVN